MQQQFYLSKTSQQYVAQHTQTNVGGKTPTWPQQQNKPPVAGDDEHEHPPYFGLPGMAVRKMRHSQYHLTFARRHDTTRHVTSRHVTIRHVPYRPVTTRHDTTLHDTTRHDTTLHYTTLHYTTLHYTTLHYTTLHYTTLLPVFLLLLVSFFRGIFSLSFPLACPFWLMLGVCWLVVRMCRGFGVGA